MVKAQGRERGGLSGGGSLEWAVQYSVRQKLQSAPPTAGDHCQGPCLTIGLVRLVQYYREVISGVFAFFLSFTKRSRLSHVLGILVLSLEYALFQL